MALASGVLARLAGVSPDTLRHYERLGVLPRPPRSPGNYRLYPESALERVRLVRRALSFGFSLAELAIVLRERDAGRRPCQAVRALAAEKLASTELRLAELAKLRDDLRGLLESWDRQLQGAPSESQARLLDTLPATPEKPAPKEIPHAPSRSHPRRHARSHPRSRSGDGSHERPVPRTPPAGRTRR